MNTEIRMQQIGDELQRAFAADLQADAHATQAHTHSRRGSWFATRRARWLAAAAATIIAVPGVAYAAGAFTSPQTVAKTLPASDRIFGSKPTCTVVRPNVEYRCTLAKAPPPDPVAHLSPRQWNELLNVKTPGPRKVFWNRDRATYPHGYGILKPWQLRGLRLAQDKVLASFGFTRAQIQASDQARKAGTAGTGPGEFKGTVELTIDATHHINGGCRATNADGTQWDCYIGHAAVKQKIVPGIGAYAQGPGVG